MRKRSQREEAERFERSGRLVAAISNHRGEFVGIVMATVATFAIFLNVLFLQKGPHPAPIFSTRPLAPVKAEPPPPRPVPLAQPQPPQLLTPPPTATPAPSRAQLITDIQRELNRKGFYDGAVDGIWGARTDAAVRDFVQASGAKINPDVSDALLRAIVASPAKASMGRATAPARNDPIAELIAPSRRTVAVQRALADFGYGQIKPTGVHDPETKAAIEKFERDRRLPVTGQISDTVIRELAAMTGRPLE